MAVRLALDTNRYTDLCRGNASVLQVVEFADEVWLPFIELIAGLLIGLGLRRSLTNQSSSTSKRKGRDRRQRYDLKSRSSVRMSPVLTLSASWTRHASA